MNKKYYFLIFILSILTVFLYTAEYVNISKKEDANSLYKVYLNDEEIGLIKEADELYNLINEEQLAIKDEFGVDNVYPPSNFNMVKINTYNDDLTEIKEVYKEIENANDFTIKGYTVTIKHPVVEGEDPKENIVINVLSKEIFDEAMHKFITAFIDDELYYNYVNEEQATIEESGLVIEAMYFTENISVKENYISVAEEIFTDVDSLTQYLVFGKDAKITSYKVKSGDTISSIASDNRLNTEEFLIANPDYQEDTLLEINSTVNVTLLNPVINFVYEVREVVEQEVEYRNITVYDYTKPSSYSEITTAGVTGLQKFTQAYVVTNGLQSQEIKIFDEEILREVVDQVTTKGQQSSSSGSSNVSTGYIETGLQFYLPVKSGAIVTSAFGVYRSGERHTGTDYSGTGSNSPIYAIADGVVVQAAEACSGCSRWTSGTHVVISHGNNYYSTYLHMYKGSLRVSVGDYVQGGQQIGGMGTTGWSTGTHLHLGFSVGEPYTGASVTYYDPHKLIYGG